MQLTLTESETTALEFALEAGLLEAREVLEIARSDGGLEPEDEASALAHIATLESIQGKM